MINASKEFKKSLLDGNRNYQEYVDITLLDGTELNLRNKDLWGGGITIDDSVSSESSFDIGSVIINQCTITINNIYEEFSDYDFNNAEVVVHIGLILGEENGQEKIEKLRKGTFYVDEAKYNGSIITLNCLDGMSKFDKSYEESSLVYPSSLSEIVADACYVCGVVLNTASFPNMDYVVSEKPDNVTTFREVLRNCAQIACSFARFDVWGRLELKWFNQDVIKEGTGLDGGIFDENSPYATGDDADGGSFVPWDEGYQYDAGTFSEMQGYHNITSSYTSNIGTDDVVVTGIEILTSNGNDPKTYFYGDEGYVIKIENNDFITEEKANSIAKFIGDKIIGFRFRKATINHPSDPTIEAGDVGFFTDRKQNSYPIIISGTTFSTGSNQSTRSSATDPLRNSADRFSEATKNYVKSRKNTSEQISNYDKSVQMLTNLITQSFGVYKTEEVLEDGSTVYYMHNKPTLEESQTVWKMTADAFAVSTDGGKTWNAGMDSSGNAVVNVLSAIGINFDWARGGTLTLGGVGNGDGRLVILNTWGAQVGYIDNTGAHFNQGEFYGAIYATEGRFYGELVSATGTFSGTLNAAKGVFSGSLSAATGTFAGQLSAASGTFSGTVSAGTVTGSNINGSNINGTTITGGSIYGSSITSNLPNYTNRIVMNNSVLSLYIDSDFGDLSGQIYPFISSDVNVDGADITVGRASALGIQANNEMRLILDSHVIARIFKHWKSNITGDPVGNDWFFQVSEKFIAKKRSDFEKNVFVGGNLTVSGTKNRIANTKNYGKRLFYCYETTYPAFGDIGSGKTDENGICYISIDSIFSESVRTDIHYHVFLQKEGKGDIWVEEKEASYFIVKGTPNLSFSWEVKAVQKDYTSEYLNDYDIRENEEMEDVSSAKLVLDEEIDDYQNLDIESMFWSNIVQYDTEMEGIFNENSTSVSGD